MTDAWHRWWNGLRHGLAWLPLLGVALLGFSALQEFSWEPILWREGLLVLIALGLFGGLCAGSLATTLAETPITAIRSAGLGYVAVKGRAQPLADRPLEGPASHKPCAAFLYSYKSGRHLVTCQSARPFRLVDASGECLVIPAGAEIDYPPADGGERLIEPGTELYVMGQYRPTVDTPAYFTDPDALSAPVRVELEGDDDAAREKAEHQLDQKQREQAEPVKLPRLPCILLPEDGRPFRICAGDKAADTSWYRLLTAANFAILLAAAALYPFSSFTLIGQ